MRVCVCVFAGTGKRASLPEYCTTKSKHCNYVSFGFATTSETKNEEKRIRPSYRRILLDTFLNVLNVQQHFLHGIHSHAQHQYNVQYAQYFFTLLFSTLLTNYKSWMPFLLLVFEIPFLFPVWWLYIAPPRKSLKSTFRSVRIRIFFLCLPPEYTLSFHYY